jgi:hypothetical protein
MLISMSRVAKSLADDITLYATEMGKKGGAARARTLSKARRREIAQLAARARWAKQRAIVRTRKEKQA